MSLGYVPLPIILSDGKPLNDDDPGFMISDPGPEATQKALKEKKLPHTSRRIAIIESSHYLPLGEAEWYARLFCASEAMMAACKLLADFARPTKRDWENGALRDEFDAMRKAAIEAVALVDGPATKMVKRAKAKSQQRQQAHTS